MRNRETDKDCVEQRPSRRAIKLRAAYNYDVDAASRLSALRCPEPSLARQDQRDEADINTIVARFGVTGTLPQTTRLPSYEDFSEAGDFHTAMEVLLQAEKAFSELPSALRAQFHNDPGAFVAYCENKENLPQLREWGLAPHLEPETVDQVVPKTAESD